MDRRLGLVAGAVAATTAVLTTMPAFFPLGRLFDPTVGGEDEEEALGLAAEMAFGFAAGVMLSPIALAIGAIVGWRLEGRPTSWRDRGRLVGLTIVIGVALFALLNRGLIDESGSTDSLQFVVTLGALCGVVAVVVYEVICRGARSNAVNIG